MLIIHQLYVYKLKQLIRVQYKLSKENLTTKNNNSNNAINYIVFVNCIINIQRGERCCCCYYIYCYMYFVVWCTSGILYVKYIVVVFVSLSFVVIIIPYIKRYNTTTPSYCIVLFIIILLLYNILLAYLYSFIILLPGNNKH